MTPAEIWLVVIVGLAAVVAATAAITWRVALARARPPAGAPRAERSSTQVAVVVNPTKKGTDRLRERITQRTAALGWAEPMWLATTRDDPGYAAARAALAADCGLVLVAGGDGTVRAVAEVLAGGRVPLGILPSGTGNMLARALGLDILNQARALDTAFGGRNRRIDVGRFRWSEDRAGRDVHDHVFTVMAGVGFDAAIMADTDATRKEQFGWWAYFESGLRKLGGPRTRVELRFDDEDRIVRRIRTVVVGNCGTLPGGIELMPDAEVDDGLLDTISIAPRKAVEWGRVALRILGRARRGVRITEHFRSRRVEIRSEEPQALQLDGDAMGRARLVEIRVDPGALIVRVP